MSFRKVPTNAEAIYLKHWFFRQAMKAKQSLVAGKRGSLEEITGRGWIFVVVIVGIVMVFGPMVYHLIDTNVGNSINTVSNNFNFTPYS